jgi:HAD superfamily hydrolase (TIGR01509 family)
MNRTPPTAVTLDLWHTLVYLDPDAEEAYMEGQLDVAARVLAECRPRPGAGPVGATEARRVFEEVYAEAVAEAHEGRSVPPATQLVRAADRLGIVPRPEAYIEGLARLVAATPVLPAPELEETLQRLHSAGHRLAVISNTVGEPGATLRPRLTELGLDRWIPLYVFSDVLPWTKPSPEIFLDTARCLGLPPDRAVHVGDGWADIEGARRAGFRGSILYTGLQRYGARYQSLFLAHGGSGPPTDHRAAHLSELPRLVERVLGGSGA